MTKRNLFFILAGATIFNILVVFFEFYAKGTLVWVTGGGISYSNGLENDIKVQLFFVFIVLVFGIFIGLKNEAVNQKIFFKKIILNIFIFSFISIMGMIILSIIKINKLDEIYRNQNWGDLKLEIIFTIIYYTIFGTGMAIITKNFKKYFYKEPPKNIS